MDYKPEDLLQGIGAVSLVMTNQETIPGLATRIQPGVGVGVLSAMMRSGLSDTKIRRLIKTTFAANASLLTRMLDMFEGEDWDINLWHLLPNGQYKVCTDLCRQPKPSWRYDPSAMPEVA